jgi:hypothetical protein
LYEGHFSGSWFTQQTENPSIISPGFNKNLGKASFQFDFKNKSELSMASVLGDNENSSHVNVLGTLFPGEFKSDEVEIEFKLSPSYKFRVDKYNG